MRNSGFNSNDLKSFNRGLVLRLLITTQKNTRIELSKETGLAKMTLSNIISEFIQQKYVGEKEIEYNTNVGRNPVTIDILPTAPKIIGVNISRDCVTAMLCDLRLNIIKTATKQLCSETEQTLKDKLIWVIDQVQGRRVIGIGVSAIGPLDAKAGVILNPTNFFSIKDFGVTDFLTEHYGLPTFLNNDMKSAALCEKTFGSGKAMSDFMYVGISNGVGSGIITDNKLYQQGGLSGEIGHVSIDYNGLTCSCSNKGCLEMYISVPELTKRLQTATNLNLSFKEFCEFDSKPVDDIMEDAMQKLSFALISQVNMLNPSGIIIGHEGAWLNQKLLKQLEQKINATKLSKEHGKVIVLKAEYGVDAPLYGGACLVLDRIFKGYLI